MDVPSYDLRQVQPVRQTYLGLEVLEAQTGASGVLTFTFTAEVDLVVVRADLGNARAAVGQTPTATLGAYCADGDPTPLPVRTDEVSVYAGTGVSVSVWGFR